LLAHTEAERQAGRQVRWGQAHSGRLAGVIEIAGGRVGVGCMQAGQGAGRQGRLVVQVVHSGKQAGSAHRGGVVVVWWVCAI
jgi:hypothetical protein